jgi:hypothetical protein
MSIPATRQQFSDYCLRELGWPVIKIEVDDDQVSDRIDQALKFFADYHFDATEKVYYKFQIDQAFIDNKYITLPDNIIGAINIFQISGSSSTLSMFDVRYQIALNDLYTLTNVSIVPYYIAFQNIAFLQEILVGQVPIRFTRRNHRLSCDIAKDKLIIGEWMIVEAYSVIDPNAFPAVWGDRWLQVYCTQLIKRQWGNNTKKYGKVQMISGNFFNGQQIYDEADKRIQEIEEKVISGFSEPIMPLMG